MTGPDARTARIAELKARYAQLKSEGQSPKAMPPLSTRRAAAIAPDNLVASETIPAGWYWTGLVRRGDILRIANPTGRAAVAFTCWNRHEPTERFYHGDTVKIQWTARLAKGRLLLSEMGRVMASIVEDSCGAHDVLTGGSNSASAERQFGPGHWRNTRDNLIGAVSKFGLGLRDIPPVITFFAATAVDDAGRFQWQDGKRQPGDFVELRAEMDLMVALSNCPHPLDPAETFDPGDAGITIFHGAPLAEDDLCRTATSEARRAFQNTLSAIAL